MRNFYTGDKMMLNARDAARLLVILAADLMEQDAFFSLYLPCACLRLAGPHLQVQPPLLVKLERSGAAVVLVLVLPMLLLMMMR